VHGARVHTAKPGVWLVYVRLTNLSTGEWSDEPLHEEDSEEAAMALARALDERSVDMPLVAELLSREDALLAAPAPVEDVGGRDDQQVFSDGASPGG